MTSQQVELDLQEGPADDAADAGRPAKDAPSDDAAPPGEAHLLVYRAGTSANCSSIGSSVDLLFASAAVGSAVFAAVMAALAVAVRPAPAPPATTITSESALSESDTQADPHAPP